MKIFLSWSGTRSRAIADVLRRWFPSVLQAVKPYFSPDDIAKGSRWSSEIAKELDASSVGLLVVTPENQDASWLVFEAGALSKNLDRSKVCPLLFAGMEPTDVKGPLVQFQSAKFSQEEMRRVVEMVNGQLGEGALSAEVLDTVFEMWWPRLRDEVEEALTRDIEAEVDKKRSERDMIEEVLSLTRRLSRDSERRPDMDHPAWRDLFRGADELVISLQDRNIDEATAASLHRVQRALKYLENRGFMSGRKIRRLIVDTGERLPDQSATAVLELDTASSDS